MRRSKIPLNQSEILTGCKSIYQRRERGILINNNFRIRGRWLPLNNTKSTIIKIRIVPCEIIEKHRNYTLSGQVYCFWNH